MNERASSAYFSSLLLHGLAIALIALLAYLSSQSTPDTAKVMELVAGPGDNYMGTEATKLGDEHGIELKVPFTPAPAAPTPPAAEPAPEPAPAEAAPVTPAEPVPVPEAAPVAPPVAKPATTTANKKLAANPILKSLKTSEIKTESKAKQKELRDEKARKKAAAAAAAKAAAKAKLESYAEFEKGQGGAAAPKGRAGGVAAGTSMADGAGGKALTAAQIDAMAAWNALLRQRWMDGFVPPADFDQKMTAQVTFHVAANGSISGIHVTGSTGGPAFEAAVADALRHVTMPPVPTKRGDDFSVDFSLRDQG